MASETSSGSLFARFLVMTYGVGLVMIGLQPIRAEYGSFYNYIRAEASQILSSKALEMPAVEERRRKSNSGIRPVLQKYLPGLSPQHPSKSPQANDQNQQKSSELAEPEGGHDHITEKDKQQLGELINSL